MDVRNKCPKFNNAIYVDGEKILEDKIEKATGADKEAFIKDLLKLWEERGEHFPSKTPKGEYAAQACQLMYDNKGILNKTNLKNYTNVLMRLIRLIKRHLQTLKVYIPIFL